MWTRIYPYSIGRPAISNYNLGNYGALNPPRSKIVAHVMQLEEIPSLDPNARPGDPAKTVARLHRWTFDMAGATDGFVREPIDDLPADFPRLDERFALNPYRYGFFAAMQNAGTFDLLVRFDLKTGKRATCFLWRELFRKTSG
jgi:carotenoid cleavage dioxygenase